MKENLEEEKALIPIQDDNIPKALSCDFETDTPKRLYDFTKAHGGKTLKGALSTWPFAISTALTIMALNSRSLIDFTVGQGIISSSTNSTILQNITKMPAENSTNITLEDFLGPAVFWPVLGTTALSSGLLAIFSRFHSLATLRNSVAIALERLGREMTKEEDNFLRLVHARLDIEKEVFNRDSDQIFVLVPKEIVERRNSNFRFIERVLQGAHGNRIQFKTDSQDIIFEAKAYESKRIKEDSRPPYVRIIHIATPDEQNVELDFEENSNFRHSIYRLNMNTLNFGRFQINSPIETPWSRWDIIFIPAKAFRFITIRCLADLLMGLGSFVSLTRVFNVDHPDLSVAVRILILIPSILLVLGRVRVNDAFKVSVAYAFIDSLILRIRYWRWPSIFNVIVPGAAALSITAVVGMYGYGFADNFGLRGFEKIGQQIGWLIPSAQNLQLPGFVDTLGGFYALAQAPRERGILWAHGFSIDVPKICGLVFLL